MIIKRKITYTPNAIIELDEPELIRLLDVLKKVKKSNIYVNSEGIEVVDDLINDINKLWDTELLVKQCKHCKKIKEKGK